jgi:flagellar hook protein FlgE
MARTIDGIQTLDVSRDTENLVIPVGSKDAARATSMVNFACNLDKRTPEIFETSSQSDRIAGTWGTEMKIFDSFGLEHILRVEFTKVPYMNNSWEVSVNVDPEDPEGTQATVGVDGMSPEPDVGNVFTLHFSNNGTLFNIENPDRAIPPEQGDELIVNVGFDVRGASVGEVGEVLRQQFGLNLGTVGGLINSVTQFAESSTTKAIIQDGYTMGYLENFKIDQSGVITGIYSNGTTRTLAQVALASFANQGGLEKAGDNTFRQSNNSGLANIGPSGTAGKGKLIAGTLEMSNVDLSEQFVDMIVTQRGFQANSRTIQTADQLLQEILTLKR